MLSNIEQWLLQANQGSRFCSCLLIKGVDKSSRAHACSVHMLFSKIILQICVQEYHTSIRTGYYKDG